MGLGRCCRRLFLSLTPKTRTSVRPPRRTPTKPTVEPLFQALCDNSALNPDTDAEEQADNPLIFDRLEAMAGAELARQQQAGGDGDGGGENGAEGEGEEMG